ncbi:hypothetical protein HZ326_5998 [Fusarium oxysporum f. sp. albedinis]|nr:hypothetical protein HZ326_5998 [Fusarium oxysporum f. sp. albedinis]
MGFSSSRPRPPTDFRCQLNGAGFSISITTGGSRSPHLTGSLSVALIAEQMDILRTAGSTAHPSSTTPGVRTPSRRMVAVPEMFPTRSGLAPQSLADS